MKRLLTILSICAFTLAGFSACEKDETTSEEKQTLPEAVIECSQDTIEAVGGTFTMTVNTEAEYSIITSRTSSGWLSQTASSGNQYTYSVAENTAGTARYATISVVDADKLTLSNLQIVQKANEIQEEHSFTVDPLAIDVEADATSATFTVTSDVDWTAVSSNSAFVVDHPTGSNNAKVTVNFPANVSPSAQTANIVVSTTNKGVPTKSFTVVISQKGFAYSFGVDNQAISVKETETSASFKITGNVAWTIISDNAAFIASPASGTGEATVNVTFPANVSTNIQVANLTVSTTNEGVNPKSYKVTITQAKPMTFEAIAKWTLNTDATNTLLTHFNQTLTQSGINNEGFADCYIDANGSGTGQIKYWSIDKSTVNPKFKFRRFVVATGEPITYGQWVGDYWYFSATPTTALAAGTTIKLEFAALSSATAQRYWIIEYKDGNEWKPTSATKHVDIAKDANYTEDQSVDYNFNFTGTDKIDVSETAVLSASTTQVEFRMRCVANRRADDTANIATVSGGQFRFCSESGTVSSTTGVVISYGK